MDVNMVHTTKGLTHHSSPCFTFQQRDPATAQSIPDKATLPYVVEFPYSEKTINLSEYVVENCAPSSPGSGNVQHFDFAIVHKTSQYLFYFEGMDDHTVLS